MAFLMCYSPQPHHHLLLLLCRLNTSPSFRSMEEEYFQQGCDQYGLGSPSASSSMLRQLQFIMPLSRRKKMNCLLRELENHLPVVVVSIPMCLLFLSILTVHPILYLKQLNHYIHIHSFKMPTIRHVRQLIQCSDHAFSTDLEDAYFDMFKIWCDGWIMNILGSTSSATEDKGTLCVLTMHMFTNLDLTTYTTIYNIYIGQQYFLFMLTW